MSKEKSKDIREADAEYGVDSRYASREERLTAGKALMRARLERLKSLSEDQIITAQSNVRYSKTDLTA